MRIYLIRHGVTELGVLNFYQCENTPLNREGVNQALSLSRVMANKNIDLIISSPLTRTKQTAEIIAKELNLKVVIDNNLKTVKRPQAVIGKNFYDEEVKSINNILEKNFAKEGWKHSNEESFLDLNKRAEEFIRSIKILKKKNILVVTHGRVIDLILAKLMFKENLTPEVLLAVWKFIYIDSASITSCEYSLLNGWNLSECNNCSHLIAPEYHYNPYQKIPQKVFVQKFIQQINSN